MKPVARTKDRIATAAAKVIVSSGVPHLTVARVAKAAGVSSALVHYHFDTKQRLIVAGAQGVGLGRAARRKAALTGAAGLAALDATWNAVVAGVHDGEERAWIQLLALAGGDAVLRDALRPALAAERDSWRSRLPGLLAELGASAAAGEEELAEAARVCVDGGALALIAGADPAEVRTAYDAFWLVLIAARPRDATR